MMLFDELNNNNNNNNNNNSLHACRSLRCGEGLLKQSDMRPASHGEVLSLQSNMSQNIDLIVGLLQISAAVIALPYGSYRIVITIPMICKLLLRLPYPRCLLRTNLYYRQKYYLPTAVIRLYNLSTE